MQSEKQIAAAQGVLGRGGVYVGAELVRAALEAGQCAAEPVGYTDASELKNKERHGLFAHIGADTSWLNGPIALYAAPPASSVAVKALRWSAPHHTTTYPEWRATGLGFEAVVDKSKPTCYGKFPLRINGRHNTEKFDTLEAAKAFAQADYDARILSALSTQVQDVAGKPIGYMRKHDNDGNSFWVHREQNAYYSEPVYAAAPAKQEG